MEYGLRKAAGRRLPKRDLLIPPRLPQLLKAVRQGLRRRPKTHASGFVWA